MDRFERLLVRWRDAERDANSYAFTHRGCVEPHSRFIAEQLTTVARSRYGRLRRELLADRRRLPML